MTTTTVISPSPTRLSFPPQPRSLLSPQQHPMEQAGEKFPSFDDVRPEEKFRPVFSPQESSFSPAGDQLSGKNWPPRRSSVTGWENRNSGGLHKHRAKRSVSEVFDNLRQKRGSISANTQELAEALKAPVSYKLIVSLSPTRHERVNINDCQGALYCVVHDIGTHQHFLQIHLECLSKAGHTDDCSICVRLTMVSDLCLPSFGLPQLKDSDSGAQEWYQISVQGSHLDCDASSGLSAPGPSPQLHGYV